MQYQKQIIKYNKMPCKTMQCNAIPCNTEWAPFPVSHDTSSFPDSCINGPVAQFRSVAFGCFRAFPKTLFGPGTPETGPNRVFASKTQQSCGKRVTWMHSARPVHRSFWVRCKKCMFHFGPPGPKKLPKRPDSGHRREKPN